MHPVFVYLLKMLLCSAILLGYYWAALRNERFHQWNRFYLLSAMLLSVLVPLMNIPLLQPAQPTAVVDMVAALPWNNVVLKYQPNAVWVWKEYCSLGMILVSGILLLHLLRSVWKVVRLYRRNTPTFFHEVSVVITEEPSAPFSFFKWLFWRSDIDPDSSNGQRMLQHELTHIHEKHSADKLFAELLLIVFWMNPFFWLMRRELYAIHEFLADQQAIERYDGAAFAAMILQAATGTPAPALSNPFFTANLKRRLHMITASHEPKYSYLRRISGLLLMIATAAVLVVSIDKAYAQDKKKTPPPPPPPKAPGTVVKKRWIIIPDSIRKAEVIDKDGQPYIKYEMKDGRKFTYQLDTAIKKGYFIPPHPPPTAPKAPAEPAEQPTTLNLTGMSSNPETQPLVIYAGLEITQSQLQQIDPNSIASIDVLKGESATKLYGEKGKNGVIMIRPKADALSNKKYTQSMADTLTTNDRYSILRLNGKPLLPKVVAVDGVRVSESDFLDYSPEKIASLQSLRGQKAIEKYGEDASDGAMEITSKPKTPIFDKVFTKIEQMPIFPGGKAAWLKYLEENLNYPKQAVEEGIDGTVVVQFIVDKEGKLHEVKALNDPGYGLAEEAVRLIQNGPDWEVGVQNGHKVVTRTTQTITFRLE